MGSPLMSILQAICRVRTPVHSLLIAGAYARGYARGIGTYRIQMLGISVNSLVLDALRVLMLAAEAHIECKYYKIGSIS